MSRRLAVAVVAAALALTGHARAAPPPVVNPLLPSGPDPFITTSGGRYYFMSTRGDRLEIRAADHLGELAQAQPVVVWREHAEGPASKAIWAPELHHFGGRWWIYFTASQKRADDDAHRRIYVLEHDGADPLSGPWRERGALATAHPGIDPTVFAHEGRLFLLYSAYVGDESRLEIALMADPATIGGPEVEIARPTQAWAQFGGRKILEGPEYLQGPTGRMFISFSASACWADEYALGLLSAPAGADPLDAAAWTAGAEPAFRTSVAAGVYAPGHNAFFRSPDNRETWIVYHANAGPHYGCDARRSPRAQPIRWRADGSPDLGVPVAAGVALPPPSGEAPSP